MRKFLASLLAASLIASMGITALAETGLPEANPETPAADPAIPEETPKTEETPKEEENPKTEDKTGESPAAPEGAQEGTPGTEDGTQDKQTPDTEEAGKEAQTPTDPDAASGGTGGTTDPADQTNVTFPALQSDNETSPNVNLQVTSGDTGKATQNITLTGNIVYYPAVPGANNPLGYMVGFTAVPPTAPSGYTLSHGTGSKTKYASEGGTNHSSGNFREPSMWHTNGQGGFHVYFMPTKTLNKYTLKVQWVYTKTDASDVTYEVTYNVDATGATFEDVQTNLAPGALSLDVATGGSNRGTLTNTGTNYTLTGGKIAYYPANPTVGNPEGNLIGLVIDPPKIGGTKLIDPDKTKTTYDYNDGTGERTGLTPEWFNDTHDKSHPGAFHVYPRPKTGTETFTIKANWVDTQGEPFTVTYTLKLENTTLEKKPEPWKLTYMGVKSDDLTTSVDLAAAGYKGPGEIDRDGILSSVTVPDPTLEGYVFDGWYTDTQLNAPADFTAKITKDTTLYAKFTKKLESSTVADAVADANVQKALTDPSSMDAAAKTAAQTAIDNVLTEAGSAASLKEAATQDQLEKLDKAYQVAAGITVIDTSSNSGQGIPSAAAVSGAALAAGNSAKDQTVTLKIEAPASGEVISQAYMESSVGEGNQVAKAVQAKVTLVYGTGSTAVTALKAPVTVGLEIPDDYDLTKLLVLKMDNGQVKKFTPDVKTIGSKQYAVVTVTEFSTFALVETTTETGSGGNGGNTPKPTPTPTPGNNGSSGGGGGGGSSSSGKGASIFSKLTSSINGILKMQLSGGKNAGTAATVSAPWTAAAAKSATSSAIGKAVDNRASVGLRNVTTISPDILSSVASQAAKAGVTATLTADTMDGAAVGARVYIDAAAAAKLGREINVSAVIGNAAVEKALSGAYKNKLAVLDLGQTGTFGMNVSIAARLNLSGMDTAKLVFYSYNAKTKQLVELTAPAYWIDTNGYIHFTTTMGNCIIVSNGPLVQK